MTKNTLPHHMVSVKKLPLLGVLIKLDSSESERAALADHLDILTLDSVTAHLRFRPWARDGVQVEGQLSAQLHSQCPVTLAPVPQSISAEFKAKFAPSTSRLAKPRVNEDGEIILELDSDDIPDIYEGEELDAWAIAMEYLMLEIDLFARAENAEYLPIEPSAPDEQKAESPFAKLQALKSKS